MKRFRWTILYVALLSWQYLSCHAVFGREEIIGMEALSILRSISIIGGQREDNNHTGNIRIRMLSRRFSRLCIRIRGGQSSSDSESIDDIEDGPPSTSIRNYIPSFPSPLGERLSNWKNETTTKAKRLFLDKITMASSALLKTENDDLFVDSESLELLEDELVDGSEEKITYQSDFTRIGRKFSIVTTASIPWFTGTAVNPLLRAAYLSRYTKKLNQSNHTFVNGTITNDEQMVTLVIPWLELEEDRLELYGTKHNFTSPQDQEEYIRSWLCHEAEMPDVADPDKGLKIIFYPARYHSGLKSIFAMGDITALIPEEDVDVCILEEPEHLNWYRAPSDSWKKKFRFVVGIIHTNYVEYASSHYSGLWTAPAIRIMSSAMVRAYCHVVIRLSDTLQHFSREKERTSNVHGVRNEFLSVSRKTSQHTNETTKTMEKIQSQNNQMICNQDINHPETNVTNAYFIGKILWTKGLDKMLELQSFYQQCTGKYFHIDIYGNGPDEKEIVRAFHGRHLFRNTTKLDVRSSLGSIQKMKSTAESLELDLPKSRYELRKTPIPAEFKGRVDHAELKDYKVFVNPSVSEVLCTTTAEALAMGKFVVIPYHPSNEFFLQFPNCLAYKTKLEFAANLHWALSHDPQPLSSNQQRLLSWEAATERLIEASAITRREARERQQLGTYKLDDRIAWFHNELGKGSKGDALRKVLGGGPVSEQVKYEMNKNPTSVITSEDGEADDGMPSKLTGSWLAETIRKTFSDGFMLIPMSSLLS